MEKKYSEISYVVAKSAQEGVKALNSKNRDGYDLIEVIACESQAVYVFGLPASPSEEEEREKIILLQYFFNLFDSY